MQPEVHGIDLNSDLRQTSVQCLAFYDSENAFWAKSMAPWNAHRFIG